MDSVKLPHTFNFYELGDEYIDPDGRTVVVLCHNVRYTNDDGEEVVLTLFTDAFGDSLSALETPLFKGSYLPATETYQQGSLWPLPNQ